MINPVAQTFFVDTTNYPQGLFVSSVDICFRKTDLLTYMPVTLQLRPTVNGYPHSSTIYPFGEVTIQASSISGSTFPSFDNFAAPNYTRFSFHAPVYLAPGEHSIVLSTNSDQYEIYVAQIGQTRLDGSERIISEQPYAGSFFKSQNGSTYTAYQDIDMMFRVNRCSFNTQNTASVVFNDVPPAAAVYGDLVNISTQDLVFNNTDIKYYYKATSNASGILTSYLPIKTENNISLSDQLKVSNTGNTLIVRSDISTTDETVAPILDLTRIHAITVQNIINNAGLTSKVFTVTNGGSGYTGNTAITLTGTGSTTANAYAVVANGNVVSVAVDTIGAGYFGSVTGVVSAPPVPGGNTTATISVSNETSSKGGNCLARYITRRVTLNDGFDASNIRVYLSAVNLAQTDIHVYYKVLAAEDPDTFDNRPYVLMQSVQQGNIALSNDTKSQHNLDFLEYMFLPVTTNCNYVGNVNNVTYTSFKNFAIKIVLTSSISTIVPRIKNFRAIALAQ